MTRCQQIDGHDTAHGARVDGTLLWWTNPGHPDGHRAAADWYEPPSAMSAESLSSSQAMREDVHQVLDQAHERLRSARQHIAGSLLRLHPTEEQEA